MFAIKFRRAGNRCWVWSILQFYCPSSRRPRGSTDDYWMSIIIFILCGCFQANIFMPIKLFFATFSCQFSFFFLPIHLFFADSPKMWTEPIFALQFSFLKAFQGADSSFFRWFTKDLPWLFKFGGKEATFAALFFLVSDENNCRVRGFWNLDHPLFLRELTIHDPVRRAIFWADGLSIST